MEDGLKKALGEAHRHYTQHINFREDWRGHLWRERFHSFPMDENYLLATVRYVERNPVAARLCELPENWKWSSACAHLKGEDDALISVRPMLDRVQRWGPYLSITDKPNDNEEIIERHNRSGRPLGNNRFVKKLEKITGGTLAPKKSRRKRKAIK
jgi:putative transposase